MPFGGRAVCRRPGPGDLAATGPVHRLACGHRGHVGGAPGHRVRRGRGAGRPHRLGRDPDLRGGDPHLSRAGLRRLFRVGGSARGAGLELRTRPPIQNRRRCPLRTGNGWNAACACVRRSSCRWRTAQRPPVWLRTWRSVSRRRRSGGPGSGQRVRRGCTTSPVRAGRRSSLCPKGTRSSPWHVIPRRTTGTRKRRSGHTIC